MPRSPEPVSLSSVTGGVDPGVWDALAGSNMYASSAWLTFCDGDAPGTGGGVHTGPAGNPRAAVAVSAVRRMGNPFYRWADLLADRDLPSWGEPALMVGQRRGYHTEFLRRDGVSLQEAAAELLPAVRELAAHPAVAELTGAGGPVPPVAMFLDTETVAAFRAAGVTSPPVLLQLDAWLPVPEGGWEGYLAYLATVGKRRGDMVRRDRRRFEQTDYTVEHGLLLANSALAGRLQACTDRRYGDADADGHEVGLSFAAQAQAMGPRAEVLICRTGDGRAVGFSLFYEWGDTLYVRAAGFDYDAIYGASEYFNLVYYLPVELAAERGLRWIHLGIEAADAKALRGARMRGLWMLDLSEDSVLAGEEEKVRAANRAYLAAAEEASKAVAHAVTDELREAVTGELTEAVR